MRCCLGLADGQALDVAEKSGYQFLSELAVNKGIFLFCISPSAVLREEFVSMCDD